MPGLNGRIAFSDFGADGYSDIFILNPDGTSLVNVTNSPDIDANPAWSPDGSKIAFMSRRDGDFDIYVMNADGSGVVNLSNASPDWDESPTWSPDGTQIAYRRGGVGIVVADPFTGSVFRTIGGPADIYPDWGPDGRIAFTSFRDNNGEIYVMNADGTGQTRLTTTARSELMPSWAPDGSRISFHEDETWDVWAMYADGTNVVRLADGEGSSWSPDGSRIVYGWGDVGGVTTMNADGTDHIAVHGGFGSQIPDRPAWGTADVLRERPRPPVVEVSLGNERGARVLWYDDTEQGTTRWFGVSAYEGSFFGSTYRIASFQSLEGRWDGTAWTWISVIGGLTFDPELTFARGGGSATLSGDFDLYRCDEPDYCSGYTPLARLPSSRHRGRQRRTASTGHPASTTAGTIPRARPPR